MSSLDLKIPPLAVCLIFAGAISAMGHYVPSANLPFPGHEMVAVAAVLVGVAVGAAAIVQFRRVHTTVNPLVPDGASTFVVAGVYRYSRNPMYLGMAVALFGVAAWWSTLAGYGLVPLFCIYLTRYQIKPEERALRARFHDSFLAYSATVRRWI